MGEQRKVFEKEDAFLGLQNRDQHTNQRLPPNPTTWSQLVRESCPRPGYQVCPPGPFGRTAPQFQSARCVVSPGRPKRPGMRPGSRRLSPPLPERVGLVDNATGQGAMTHGHALSKDLTRWAHMPVSIWNDRNYDLAGVWSGSATVANDKICHPGRPGNQRGDLASINLCLAAPADPHDQLQTNWSKSAAHTARRVAEQLEPRPLLAAPGPESTAFYSNSRARTVS